MAVDDVIALDRATLRRLVSGSSARRQALGREAPRASQHFSVRSWRIAFGQWDADPENPFDRQPVSNDRFRNVHKQLPFDIDVHQGGAVSFLISGLHQMLIYDD